MKLYFKQRFFSWLDSYDVFDESGNAVYVVKGELSFGHKLNVYNLQGQLVGTLKEKVFKFLPEFEIYVNGAYFGCIKKELSFFKPKYNIDFCGWHAEGNFMEWDYSIFDSSGQVVAYIQKEIFNFTDTYSIDVANPADALYALTLVLAIDAEKCSRS